MNKEIIRKEGIKNTILNLAQKNRQIIHGGQATNINLPSHLRRDTVDYDIFTKHAKKSAINLATELNKKYGKESFKVEPALHKGTFKVKGDGKTIADYTGNRGVKPKVISRLGVRYVDNNYSKAKLKAMIKDKRLEFRHDKDLDTLKRIKQSEVKNGL